MSTRRKSTILRLLPLLLVLFQSADCAKKRSKSTSPTLSSVQLTADEKAQCKQVKWLFQGVSCRKFVSRYWEKRPLLSKGAGKHAVGNLFKESDFGTLLQLWDMRSNASHGQVLFIKPGTFLHDKEMLKQSERVSLESVENAIEGRRTVVVHNLEIYWGPVSKICLSLSKFFHLYSQANLYWSPGGLKSSIGPHQDAQDVFIVQLSGHKTWKLFKPVDKIKGVPNGFLSPVTVHRGKGDDTLAENDLGGKLLETRLSPGDVLFIPRSIFHSTSTLDETENSLHLTIGIETETDGQVWSAAITDSLNAIMKQAALWKPEFREALPLKALRKPMDSDSEFVKNVAVSQIKSMLHYLSSVPDATLAKAFSDTLSQRHGYVEAKREQQVRFLENFEARTTTGTTTVSAARAADDAMSSSVVHDDL